jgi:DNA-binding transcriptional ArsR family regulator
VSLNSQEPSLGPAAGPPAVSDARRLRALTHPVRLALLRELMLHGPLTATEAGELIGESPTTCSFHFRQLAKYGVVEEAGGGKGRARPWRMTTTGLAVTARDDPASRFAQDALLRMVRQQQIERYWTWLNTRSGYPRRWQDAAEDSEYLIHLTVEELEQLGKDLTAIVMPLFHRRMADPAKRPPGSVPVQLLLLSHPVSHPAESQEDREAEAGHADDGPPG